MPKKTKKEKRLADMRHKETTLTHSLTITPQPIQPSVTSAMPIFSFRSQQHTQDTTPRIFDSDEYGPIRRDLAKTMVLATAAVIIELLLYIKIGR